MTGNELKEIRRRLDLDRLAMARLIGYTGTDRNDVMRIKRLENRPDRVPLYIARLVWLIDRVTRGDVPFTSPPFQTGTINWPNWPGYEFDHSPDQDHIATERIDVG